MRQSVDLRSKNRSIFYSQGTISWHNKLGDIQCGGCMALIIILTEIIFMRPRIKAKNQGSGPWPSIGWSIPFNREVMSTHTWCEEDPHIDDCFRGDDDGMTLKSSLPDVRKRRNLTLKMVSVGRTMGWLWSQPLPDVRKRRILTLKIVSVGRMMAWLWSQPLPDVRKRRWCDGWENGPWRGGKRSGTYVSRS